MITLGKEGSLHARRRAAAYIRTKSVVSKLFKDIAGRFLARKGGYTRLIKTRRRVGDAAPMVVIELVNRPADTKDAAKGQPADQNDAGGSPTKSGSTQPKTPAAAGA
jgi:large subunit ribosomal protein L17